MKKPLWKDDQGRAAVKEGQGFNDARGEIPDKKDIPKNNGQNVNNDPKTRREKNDSAQAARGTGS